MGPKVLTLEEISRYVDGELSEDRRREVEFQAESFNPSREKLNDHRAAADQIASLFEEIVFNDPAYRSFVRMVEDFEPRSIDMDIQAIRKLIPDPDRLKRLLNELASDIYGSVPDVSMNMMSLERAPSRPDDIGLSAMSGRVVNPSRISMELARHLDEFAGINGQFVRTVPACHDTLRKLENSVMALRKILPEEADPEIAFATVCIEQLVQDGLPGAKIMSKIVQGESVLKRDYQMAVREITLFIESSR